MRYDEIREYTFCISSRIYFLLTTHSTKGYEKN